MTDLVVTLVRSPGLGDDEIQRRLYQAFAILWEWQGDHRLRDVFSSSAATSEGLSSTTDDSGSGVSGNGSEEADKLDDTLPN